MLVAKTSLKSSKTLKKLGRNKLRPVRTGGNSPKFGALMLLDVLRTSGHLDVFYDYVQES